MWESCLCYSLVLILSSVLEDARILPMCVCACWRAPPWPVSLKAFVLVGLLDNHTCPHGQRLFIRTWLPWNTRRCLETITIWTCVINADDLHLLGEKPNTIPLFYFLSLHVCGEHDSRLHGDCSSVFFSMPNTLHVAVFYVFHLIFKATGWWRAWMWD